MQITRPNDIEDSLRTDIVTILARQGLEVSCFAPPAPDNLKPQSVCFTSTGGIAVTPVAYSHGVSVDCWAATDAEAMAIANAVCGIVGALTFYETEGVYPETSVNLPYLNPDPNRPTMPRATFNANVTMRGESITDTVPTD